MLNSTQTLRTKITSSATVILFYLYSFSLSLRPNLKAILLLALILVFIIQQIIDNRPFKRPILKHLVFRLLIIFTGWGILSLLWTEDLREGLEFIMLQASLLLLPLIFFQQFTAFQVKMALHLFVAGCFLLSCYALLTVVQAYFIRFPGHSQVLENSGLWQLVDWTFISYNLPQLVQFHAPFYSLYIGICLICISHYLYQSFRQENKIQTMLYLVAGLFFLAFQALLASRTALVATLGVISLAVFYQAARSWNIKAMLTLLCVTGLVGVVIYHKVPYLKAKISSNAGVSERTAVWEVASQLLFHHPFSGVGPGDRQEALRQAYFNHHFQAGLDQNLNAHNQYLDTSVALGFPGLALLLAIIATSLYLGFKNKNYLLFCTVLLIALCCFTESVLQRKDGVLLVSFVLSTLIFAPKAIKPSVQIS